MTRCILTNIEVPVKKTFSLFRKGKLTPRQKLIQLSLLLPLNNCSFFFSSLIPLRVMAQGGGACLAQVCSPRVIPTSIPIWTKESAQTQEHTGRIRRRSITFACQTNTYRHCPLCLTCQPNYGSQRTSVFQLLKQ